MVALASALASAAVAWAGIGKLKGQIIVSDQPLPTGETGDQMAAALLKANKTTVEHGKGTNIWTIHVMAFLNSRPGVKQLSLMFYDLANGKRNYVASKDVSCDVNAEILALDVDVSEDDGIKPGDKVELDMAKIVGDKETDLAKTKVIFAVGK
jgi:hypothetical protein